MLKKQLILAASDFERYRKPTRREKFLAEMNTVVPWQELAAVIEPYYPKATSAGGRPPVGLERMLRIHCLQLWFDLSDPAVEEALYDSLSMRSFVGIDLGREPVPDETTVMRFSTPRAVRAAGHERTKILTPPVLSIRSSVAAVMAFLRSKWWAATGGRPGG